jgi:predicted O-linked N-acetylglucosamine transferase (SPINDLY family)
MSPSVSGYKVFEYNYYRCRSRASGRPPCKGVGISAYEIEEFVRTTLSSEDLQQADPTSATVMQEFTTAWRDLDSWQQRKALASVVKKVLFDPNGGTVSVTLAEDALEQLRPNRAD